MAMTGFQPNPQQGRTATGDPTKTIMIEDIARACGIDYVEVVEANNLKAAEAAFKRMLSAPGIALVVSRHLCATEEVRRMRPHRPVPYVVDDEKCVGCKLCLSTFGCPALNFDDTACKTTIDGSLCIGCGVCAQVCNVGCISRRD